MNSVVLPDGSVKGLGHLPPNRPCKLKAFKDAVPNPQLTNSEILTLINDPNRTSRRVLFGDTWIQQGNQGQYGSCNGWALASAASKIRYLGGLTDGMVLSGSYTYSKMNGGSDNGSSLSDDIDVLETYGAPPASVVTASMIYPRLQPENADQLAAQHKGLVMYSCETQQEVLSAIALGFPVVVCLQVAGQWENFSGTGILPSYSGQGNHAIHADGLVYQGGQFLLDCCNNWGLNWGDNGRALASWSSFAQPIESEPFIVVASISEGGQ